MKRWWKEGLLSLVLAVGVPWLIFSMARAAAPFEEFKEETTCVTKAVDTKATENTEALPAMICVLMNGQPVQMDLEKYLQGVVLAEMPGSFPMEAKKAQAVVARTYALRSSYAKKHAVGAICTEHTCCQAYTDPEAFLDSGGELWIAEEAAMAVEQTRGQVLTYQDELIEATYFSCSGGMTEDAVAVWGTDIPYLQSVESPGEESAEFFTETVYFTEDSFENLLGKEMEGKPEEWFGRIEYAPGGTVTRMEIGETPYTGSQLRSLLGLRSASFTVTVEENVICITTKGYGHRVGMSQYGARAMALEGVSYDQILLHYYQGTELAQIKG